MDLLLTSLGLNFPTCPMGERWISKSLRDFPAPRLQFSYFSAIRSTGWQNLIAMKYKGGPQNLGEKVIGTAVFPGIIITATPTFPELFHLFIALESDRLGFKA